MINFNVSNNAVLKEPKFMCNCTDLEFNDYQKIINAVEIDWNAATLDQANPENGLQYGPINDTTQLLDLINTMQKEIYVLTDAVITLSNKQDFYWYIGINNPLSISDIQTDNTKPGWHSIGSSLSGFVFDSNQYTVVLYTTNTKSNHYIVIPNELSIYDGLGNDMTATSDFEEVSCNISGYKAYKSTYQVRVVTGLIIK